MGFEGEKDDGCFFMSFEDLVAQMKMVEVTDRSVNIETEHQLRIEDEN